MAKKKTKKAAVKKKAAKKIAPVKFSFNLGYGSVALILIFAAILIGIFTYSEQDAVLAAFFHDILFGLFAKTARLIPLAMAGLGIYVIKQKSYEKLHIKSLLTFLFLVCVASLVHVLSGKSIPAGELYGYGMQGVGGGFLGGILSFALVGTISTIGAVIVLIFLIVMLMSIILNVSIASAAADFVSGLLERRKNKDTNEDEEAVVPTKRTVKVKVVSKPKPDGENLDFEIDAPKKKKERKTTIASEEKDSSEIESIIFTPDPEDAI